MTIAMSARERSDRISEGLMAWRMNRMITARGHDQETARSAHCHTDRRTARDFVNEHRMLACPQPTLCRNRH